MWGGREPWLNSLKLFSNSLSCQIQFNTSHKIYGKKIRCKSTHMQVCTLPPWHCWYKPLEQKKETLLNDMNEADLKASILISKENCKHNSQAMYKKLN